MKKSLKITLLFALLPLILLTGCGRTTPEEELISAMQNAEAGNWKKARKHAERAVSKAPDHAGALIMRAIACEKSENYDQAIDSARRAAKLSPGSYAALYTLGRLYSSNPLRNAEAINTLNAALKIRPDAVEPKILIVNLLSRMGENAGARPYLLQLQKVPAFANDPALLNRLGVLYALSNQTLRAQTMFVRAFKYAGNDPDTVFNTARFFTFYNPQRQFSRQLYSRFEKLAAGSEKYTAELDEARSVK